MSEDRDGISRHALSNSVAPWTRRLWVHSLALACLMIVLIPVVSNGYPSSVDEAVYASQAANLTDGAWASDRVLPDLDDHGRHDLLMDSYVSGNKMIPYYRQPLYPLILVPAYAAGGFNALLTVSAAGTFAAAVTAACIARRLRTGLGIVTLWFTALGTPLLYGAFIAIGHSIAAGLAGLTALAIINCCDFGSDDDGRPTFVIFIWAFVALMSAALLTLVRSEGVLVGVTLGAFCAISAIHGRDAAERWRRVALGLMVTGIGVSAYFLNGAWVGSITSGTASTSGSIRRQTDPLQQAWVSLLRPWAHANTEASTTATLVILCVVLAALVWRFAPRRSLLALALLMLAAATSIGRLLEAPALISGLLAATPVLAFGLVLVGRRELKTDIGLLLLGSAGTTAAAILWLAYGVGGATEWGGRFFYVLIPLTTPLALTAMARAFASAGRSQRVIAVSALAIMTASLSVVALRNLHATRDMNRSIVSGTVEVASTLPDGTPILVGMLKPTGISRIFWREARSGLPVLNGGNLASTVSLLPQLHEAGHDTVIAITEVDPASLNSILSTVQDQDHVVSRWSIAGIRGLEDSPMAAIILRADPSSPAVRS